MTIRQKNPIEQPLKLDYMFSKKMNCKKYSKKKKYCTNKCTTTTTHIK